MAVDNIAHLQSFKIVRLNNGKFAAQNQKNKSYFLDLRVDDEKDKSVFEWARTSGSDLFLTCLADTKEEVENAIVKAMSVLLKGEIKENQYMSIKVVDTLSSVTYDKIKKIKNTDKVLMFTDEGNPKDRLMTYAEWKELFKKEEKEIKLKKKEEKEEELKERKRTRGYKFKRIVNLFFAGNFYPTLEEYEN